jgi:hypothetical protein
MTKMPDLTFVIPIGPAHIGLSRRAIDSVKAQTVPCLWLAMHDEKRRGPGYLRNQMLERVTTEFVSFLDADDWVEPTFAEETLAAHQSIGGGKYIYTDWLDADKHPIAAPCLNGPNGTTISANDRQPYCGGAWHVLTTLMPTEWARSIGGFDEYLPAVEDTDFYLKLCVTMHCGYRLARPLFHYSPDGGRAKEFRTSPDYHKVMGALTQRYGGKVGCCGGDSKVVPPTGEKQPNDVQAMALWHGNRTEYGRVTGRVYPRISFPKTTWVDPRDVSQSPALWKLLDQKPVDAFTGLTQVAQIAELGMAGIKAQAKTMVAEPPPPVQTKPNVARVIALAKQTSEPTFVFSDKPYPSYSDIRRLVELSGFKAITTKQIDAFSRAPYIVVAPEPIPDLNGLKARVICWQLEYAGDYTHNYDGFTGEVWASDKAWADEHGSKYVLLGSHPGLADGEPLEPLYDVTMLGYMIPRRQAIKDALSDLRWPIDYPGHDTTERDTILLRTRLMLHVHQHEGSHYIAPQRIAIAAAHHMPVISETVKDAGDLNRVITFRDYVDLIPEVAQQLSEADSYLKSIGEEIHQYLCIERPFRTCVMEALK